MSQAARKERSRAASSSPRRDASALLDVDVLLEPVEDPEHAAELLGGHALEVERVHQHLPAPVQLADEVGARDLDTLEEDLAERAASQRRETPDGDPRGGDVGDEHGDALVLRPLRIRAHREVDPVGEVGARGPDLVPVDDETVAREHGRRAQRGEVASRPRLREALAEDELAAGDRRQQLLLQVGLREALERGADRLRGEQVEGERQPVVAEDLLDERRVQVREAPAAHLLRPRKPDPPRPAELAGHVARVAVGEKALAPPLGVRLEHRTQALAERSRLLAERQLLGCEPRSTTDPRTPSWWSS